MFRHFATMIALWTLLTQAVLGGALPGAVLCIKAGEGPCAPAPEAHECSCCCGAEETPASTTILVCTPCHEGCGDCVEVDLPNELFAAAAPVALPGLAVMAMAVQMTPSFNSAWTNVAPACYGTGPPELRRCPDALIVASTILLL